MNNREYDVVLHIEEQVREEHDRFVFETIKPYCEKETQMIISKRILCRALQCFQEEHFDEYAMLKKEVDHV